LSGSSNSPNSLPFQGSVASLPNRPTNQLLQRQDLIPQLQLTAGTDHVQSETSHLSIISSERTLDLSDHQNCALWIMNIPSFATISDIFDQIHFGTVFSLQLRPSTPEHPGAAAKLVFMKPESAKLMKDVSKDPGIWMADNRLVVRYNRDGCHIHDGSETRTLQIEGPTGKMTFEKWNEFFNKSCESFELDRWLFLPCSNAGRKRMEFRFSRINGQSQVCRAAIGREPEFRREVTVRYGLDPCDPNSGRV